MVLTWRFVSQVASTVEENHIHATHIISLHKWEIEKMYAQCYVSSYADLTVLVWCNYTKNTESVVAEWALSGLRMRHLHHLHTKSLHWLATDTFSLEGIQYNTCSAGLEYIYNVEHYAIYFCHLSAPSIQLMLLMISCWVEAYVGQS